MNWRPEGWYPNYTITLLEDANSGDLGQYTNAIIKSAFEAGADGMLEAIREEIEKALLSKEALTQINDAMPSDAKYGEVFMAIAQAQLQKILKIMSSEEV